LSIDALMLHPTDNVATAIRDLNAGEVINCRLGDQILSISLVDNIPYGHKLAVRPIDRGQDIMKYGETIGRATAEIPQGAHAHIQNIESLRGRGDLHKEDKQ